MPIFEFVCPKHGKFEAIVSSDTTKLPCPYRHPHVGGSCYRESKKVDFSIPAKRDPRHGIQR